MVKTIEKKVDDIIEEYRKEIYGNEKEMENLLYPVLKEDIKAIGNARCFFVNLDNFVRKELTKCRISNGIIVLSSKHTTSCVYINHFEKGIMFDLSESLKKLYPNTPKKYQHNVWDCEFKNADAHLKAMSIGKNCMVVVKESELLLGDFQNIIYAEFDNRPGKSITITYIGDINE